MYLAKLTYCHNNRLDVNKILFGADSPIVLDPAPVEVGKVNVKYFRTLASYWEMAKQFGVEPVIIGINWRNKEAIMDEIINELEANKLYDE